MRTGAYELLPQLTGSFLFALPNSQTRYKLILVLHQTTQSTLNRYDYGVFQPI